MGKQVELIMPKMGESIAEATILKWLKQEGESIDTDEAVLEIATDKVDSEVPAPQGGTLVKMLYNEGDVVPVGKAVAIISLADGSQSDTAPQMNGHTTKVVAEEKTPAIASLNPTNLLTHAEISHSDGGRFYSPLVLNIARNEGVSMDVLERLPGSGKDGRVTKKDILNYVENKGSIPELAAQAKPQEQEAPKPTQVEVTRPEPQTTGSSKPAPATTAPEITLFPGDEVIEMDRMRKMIAEHMVMSKHVSPHVTSFVEADVTNLVKWRDKVKNEFEKREGEKITFTPIFIEAVVNAIKEFPMINVSVSGTNIIKKKNINIGMAAALPSGNLIVPVIKNADSKNLLGLTKEVNDFARRSRSNQLKPDEIQGATFTITNVGTFGNLMGTPIISQPQVAILATGAIKKKPVVLETEFGDIIAIRHMMFLSLSYDHRVVDGMLGGSFLRKIADNLEAFDINRKY